jgi:hypothetical protein
LPDEIRLFGSGFAGFICLFRRTRVQVVFDPVFLQPLFAAAFFYLRFAAIGAISD